MLNRILRALSSPAWQGLGVLVAIVGLGATLLARSDGGATEPPPDPGSSSQAQDWTDEIYDGRVGVIEVTNFGSQPAKLSLWHPDTDGPYKHYYVPSEGIVTVEGSRGEGFGNDWGFNFDSGAVVSLSDGAAWREGVWRLKAE